VGKLVVVENDPVQGTDTHNVAGTDTFKNPYSGTGDFDYKGKMTDALSDFFRIGGKPVATVGSRSSLDPGETAPGGGHSGPRGSNWNPSAPAPDTALVNITGPVGEGRPSATAGSTFVKVGGEAVLMDADPIDTCGIGPPANSRVAAEGQSFVSCSA
jgi:hypothetical protein